MIKLLSLKFNNSSSNSSSSN